MNHPGALAGLGFEDRRVTTPEGWNSPVPTPGHGGMGLPRLVNACIPEMFQGANMSFPLCPTRTQGAIEGYAPDGLKHAFLPKLVTGEWTGTMNLIESQADSGLAAVRSRTVPGHERAGGPRHLRGRLDHGGCGSRSIIQPDRAGRRQRPSAGQAEAGAGSCHACLPPRAVQP